MKDIGIYLGSLGAGTLVYDWLGSLSKFTWWQWVLIGFMVLALAIIGGIIGMATQELILKSKEQWMIGKHKSLKKHLSAHLR